MLFNRKLIDELVELGKSSNFGFNKRLFVFLANEHLAKRVTLAHQFAVVRLD